MQACTVHKNRSGHGHAGSSSSDVYTPYVECNSGTVERVVFSFLSRVVGSGSFTTYVLILYVTACLKEWESVKKICKKYRNCWLHIRAVYHHHVGQTTLYTTCLDEQPLLP